MGDRLEKILCAVDFSNFSNRAVDYGKKLATCFNARLFLFHAVHFPSDRLYASDVLERGEKEQKLSAKAHERINNTMTGEAVAWEPVVTCGDPVEEIRHIAADRDIDLVIAASHGLSGLGRIFLGTVVERLARTLSQPILVIRPSPNSESDDTGSDPKLNRILVGCNILSHNNPVLDFALNFAEHVGADLHLLHAVEAPVDEALVDPTQGPYSEVQSKLTRRLHHQLDQSISDDSKKRFNIKTAVTEGLPGEVLASYAAKIGADLIIVGVQRRNMLEKLIVRSTTESMLRHAPCPVLTIPHLAVEGRRGGGGS